MPYAEFLLRLRAGAIKQIRQIKATAFAFGTTDTGAISELAQLENLANGR